MRFHGSIRADARALPLADESVQCCVTSPPYFGLRDYKQDAQIGLESTPTAYVAALLEVFIEVWRVLKNDGTLWLNLGDSYANDAKWGGASGGKHVSALHGNSNIGRGKKQTGLKPKDLIGIPWRVAFALQSEGWYLRSDIVWHKPNPMPESVTDRPTRAHEYIFLLTKSERYYYDHEAIKEPSTYGTPNSPQSIKSPHGQNLAKMDKQRGHGRRHEGFNDRWDSMSKEEQGAQGRNKRDVWTVATLPYAEAHYATFPPALIEPCILAGSRLGDFILDPFAGSGVTAMVSEKFGRKGISIDLGYQDLQKKRLQNLQPILQPIC